MMKRIRVLIVDDHDLFRAGICCLLEGEPELEVVGEVGSGREALEQIPIVQPDVVLLDILMPELNGLDVSARIASQYPTVRILMLSMNSANEYVIQSLRAGAAGYLVKTINPDELKTAILHVMRGETYLTPKISRSEIERILKRDDWRAAGDRLTSRQREVLLLVAEGRRTKEIAKKLGISIKTVELHRTQLMAALDIHDVPGLVRHAIRIGLIGVES